MNELTRTSLLELFHSGLSAVDPAAAIERWFNSGESISAGVQAAGRYDRVIVVGAGKAAGPMATATEQLLGDRLSDGLVIVKDGHGVPLRRVRQRDAAHPVPDARGQAATAEMLELLKQADERTLVLCLLSGGGSALLCAPVNGITLADKQMVTDLLLRSGADIGELNSVRKHLSLVKGGGLARAACDAAMVTLILSDVLGDRLDVIASGPTVPDSSTYQDALKVIGKYDLRNKVPVPVLTHLARGVNGFVPETMKPDDPCSRNKSAVIVGGLGQALEAAKNKAESTGCISEIVGADLHGEAREAAHLLADKAIKTKAGLNPGERRCLISGGETTVTIKGTGKGGRNQELALAFALNVAGQKGITFLSAGTDGTDGPTDAAGAIVDGDTVSQAGDAGLDARLFLENNDSYSFFCLLDQRAKGDHHIKTGPTGTNVMDMQIVVIEA